MIFLFICLLVKTGQVTGSSMITPPIPSMSSETSNPQDPDCATLLESAEDVTDPWKSDGNAQLLSALNAAMAPLTQFNSKWSIRYRGFGGASLTPTQGQWPNAEDAVGTFKYVLDSGKIRFGSTFTMEPLSYNESGCLKGEEIYLADLICAEFSKQYNYNITARWAVIPRTSDFFFDTSFALSGSDDVKVDDPLFDVLLSSVTRTESRIQRGTVAFTTPYLAQKYGVILSELGVSADIKSISDLNNPNWLMACSNGTSTLEFSRNQYPKCGIVFADSFVDRMMKVKNNDVHFAVGDAITVKNYRDKYCPKCVYLGEVGDTSFLAMAVRPTVQPGSNTTEVCEILSVSTTAYDKNCHDEGVSSCMRCDPYGPTCSRAKRDKQEGYCCTSSSCCASYSRSSYDSYSYSYSRSRSRSRSSNECNDYVKRRGFIKCKDSLQVIFSAKLKRTGFTDNDVSKDCRESENCVTDYKAQFSAGTSINCTKNLDGSLNLHLPDLYLGGSTTTKFVSLLTFFMVGMVQTLFH